MISAAARATFEAQATACLQVAEKYRPHLLALAVGLSGSKEEGHELYQQATLNCHDAIQAGGFQGDGYNFYLRRAIKNLHYRNEREKQRLVPFTFAEPTVLNEELPSEWEVDNQEKMHRQQWLAANVPEAAYTQLAEQVMAEAQARFSFADRVALRLSLDGMSCQQIAEHIGTKDQSWVWRRLKRMKEQLRETFQSAFDALSE
jgi:RNA polymerase sigma factor (sigma-70 family)